MDARVRNLFLNIAVCLYAVLGFSLSVLSSFFTLVGVWQPQKPNVVPLSKSRLQSSNRTLQCSSIKPSKPTDNTAEPVQTENHPRGKLYAVPRRPRPIPVITLDHIGSTENLNKVSHGADLRSQLSPIQTFELPLPSEQELSQSPSSAGYDTEKSGFRLANLFSKEKQWEKDHLLGGTPSTPGLDSSRLEDSLQIPMKRRKSDVSIRSSESQTNLSRVPVRRVCSAPMEEKLVMKFDLTFSRPVVKKKSNTLRTQPYEAPFFCPPPVHPKLQKSRSAVDLKLNTPTRSLTMK